MEGPDPIEAHETIVDIMSRILFVTTKQPSTNPRMRKAADALAEAGHTVHVLYAYNVGWAAVADEEILSRSRWTHQRIGGDPVHEKWKYHAGRLRRKFDAWCGHLEGSYCRSLRNYIRIGVAWNPDLVIGHNPGALFPTREVARRLNIPSLFDAEDFHRGETSSQDIQGEVTRLEDKWLDHFSMVTTAAPLITERYQQLYPDQRFATINNAFPSALGAKSIEEHDGPLRIVWFSQVVGADRGLEPFLEGLGLIPDIPCQLTIIGQCTVELRESLAALIHSDHHQLVFHPPMEESRLFQFLATQEVGLALELGHTENHQLCRSNKLYSYPLAGCYTLASHTPSQDQFFEEFEGLGKSFNLQDPIEAGACLAHLFENRIDLSGKRRQCLATGQSILHWKSEAQLLRQLVHEVMTQPPQVNSN